MKQSTAAKESESQVDKKPPSNFTSLTKLPLWLITSLALLLASLVSFIYFYLRGSKSKPRQGNSSLGRNQAENKTHLERETIKETPVFSAAVENIKPPEQNKNPIVKWFESLNIWSLSGLTPDRIQKNSFSAARPVLALVIAYMSQGVFDSITGVGGLRNWTWLLNMSESSRLWLGAAGYLISMVIWFFSAPSIQAIGAVIHRPDPSNLQKFRYHPVRFLLLFTSISIYFVSALLFLSSAENGAIRILWAAGLICFILSQIPWTWFHITPHPEAEESPRFRWQNWLVLALILGVGFWLRFYHVATIPDDFHGDMASHGWVARDFLLGIQHNIFGFGWTATPTMGFLPAFLTMAVFGNNIFGLQMAAVIGGTFSLLAVYLLVWRLFDSHRLAALTTALVAINVVHIHFSRIFNMDPWPLCNFAIFLFIDGLKARRSTSFGLAGVFLGFSLLMYTSGRVLPFIMLAFLVYVFFFHRSWITQNKSGLALMSAGVLITMGPALIFYLKSWNIFISRSQEVYIFAPGVLDHLLNKYNTNSAFTVLLTQIKLTLLMFNQSTDTSSQFGFPHPMFSSLISPLILLGLAFALRRWKDAGVTFILIWLGFIAVLGSILTIDAPFWPRLVGIIPPAALLVAVAFDQILELGRKIFDRRAVVFIAAFIAIFLVIVGYLTWNQYYLAVRDDASPSTMTGRFIYSLPLNVTACSITDGPPLNVRETSFLAWPHKLVDIKPDAPDSDLDTCIGSSIVWVISPENIGRLPAIRTRWPDGVIMEHYFPVFDYTLTFYLVGVTPPASPPISSQVFRTDDLFNQIQWLLDEIKLAIPFILYGILILLFSRALVLNISHARQAKHPPHLPIVQAPHPIDAPASNRNMFAAALVGLNEWYNEITSFKFPAISSKLIISTLLSLLAVALAYFAQTFLDQQNGDGLHLPINWFSLSSESQILGVACFIYFVAALIWIFTTTDRETDASHSQILNRVKTETPSSQNNKNSMQFAGNPMQIVSIFFTVSAMFFYVAFGETSLVRWLWIAGLILFLVSLLIKNKFDTAELREESPAFRWVHVLILLSLLILAFCLRVYRLYDVPLDLSTDMASVGINARAYLLGTEQRIFGTGWYFMPRLTFIPYAASMAVMGNNLFGLYFATVIMGTLNILGVYLFVWRLFDRHRLALLTAVLVTINPAHIDFSRITSYMDPWFFGFFGLFFFIDGLKGRRKASLALAGLFTGFTLVSYPSGRAIIPLIAIGLVCAWLYKRKWVTDNYAGLGWMALGLLVSLGPNLIYLITNWSVYMQRTQQVIIFNPGNIEHLKYTYEVNSIWLIVWEQIKRSVLLFNYYTDRSAQFAYPHPMFNSLVSPLLILGFGMGLYRWKKPEFLFTISAFLFLLITGSILTDDAPTWVRLVGIIPFAALLIALAMDEFVNIFERVSLKPFVPFLLFGMTLFLGVLAVTDWNTYLTDVGNKDSVRPEVHVARYLDALPDDITACGLTDEYAFNQEEIVFLGWPRSMVVVPVDTAALTSNICPGKKLVWILSPTFQNRLSELQSRWPGGIVEDHLWGSGKLMFISYLVSSPPAP
jgi:4-amino-4-deoxy-L-arabinose transferase-like glycosyltransferase